MKKQVSTIAALVLALGLTGCGSAAPTDAGAANGSEAVPEDSATQEAPAAPLDLTGEWSQTNSNDPESFQSATITGDAIEIEWNADGGDTRALYWAGTYVAPTEATQSYSWDSANDTSRTETALMASDAPTKTFTYENGVLSYELTAMGVTMTVELERG